ncbi:hypothetical protein [Culturomica massiliensis]|uniref:hypothetical protein n=1 Tax=Culturomica massiliensis TaxID=1841857 RepID=UPI000838E4BA|nr:hypothetical protein [Culturomica massiliensis]
MKSDKIILQHLKFSHNFRDVFQRLGYKDYWEWEGSLNFDIHVASLMKLQSINAYIASFKFCEFENVFFSASYALEKASEEKNNCSYVADKYIYPEYEFLKNAILWYNACYDHILQVIYFVFDFNDPVKSEMTYRRNLVKCRFSPNSPFYKKFQQLAEENKFARELFDRLTDFYRRTPLDTWANRLKHTGDFWFGGNYPPICEISFQEIDTDYEFLPSFLKGIIPSEEEVIEELIRQNNRIVSFVDYLYQFIGFAELHSIEKDIISERPEKYDKKFSAKNLNEIQ